MSAKRSCWWSRAWPPHWRQRQGGSPFAQWCNRCVQQTDALVLKLGKNLQFVQPHMVVTLFGPHGGDRFLIQFDNSKSRVFKARIE